jgi:hypothetical protein
MKNFTVLQTIAFIFRILGIGVIVLAGFAILVMVLQSTTNESTYSFIDSLGGSVLVSIISVFLTLGFLAVSEIIMLFLQIEKNTRPENRNIAVLPPTSTDHKSVLSEKEKSEKFKKWRECNPDKSMEEFYTYMKELSS